MRIHDGAFIFPGSHYDPIAVQNRTRPMKSFTWVEWPQKLQPPNARNTKIGPRFAEFREQTR